MDKKNAKRRVWDAISDVWTGAWGFIGDAWSVIVNVLLCVGLVLLVVVLIFGSIHRSSRRENADTVIAYCEIVEKYFSFRERGGSDPHMVLSFEAEDEVFLEDITCGGYLLKEIYNNKLVGDEVLCKVTYDSAGIVDFEVLECVAAQN